MRDAGGQRAERLEPLRLLILLLGHLLRGDVAADPDEAGDAAAVAQPQRDLRGVEPSRAAGDRIDERLLALHHDAVVQHAPVVLGERRRRSPAGKKSKTVLPLTSVSPATPSSRRLRMLLRT